MKLLYIPLRAIIAAYSDDYTQGDDLYDAFAKRCEVHAWTNIEQAIAFDPDVVYLHSGTLPLEPLLKVKENTNAVWTQWTGDVRLEQLEPVMRYENLCDLHFMSSIQDIYPFKINWLPHAVADWQFKPVHKAEGIVYIANEYHHFPGGLERYELACLIRDTLGLTWHGSGTIQVNWRLTPDIYNAHAFSIGANCFNDIPYYFSDRPQKAMAAGCCHLMRWIPGIDELFDDSECIIYKKNSEVIPLIKGCKNREEIAKKGQAKIRKEYTYDAIVDKYLKQL